MKAAELKVIADREKTLFTECPHCFEMWPLFDKLKEELEKRRDSVWLIGSKGAAYQADTIWLESLALRCRHCGGSGRILTDVGRALATALANENGKAEEEIPF